jgi:hypothetical protein
MIIRLNTETPSGIVKTYYSHPLKKRACGVQIGDPQISQAQAESINEISTPSNRSSTSSVPTNSTPILVPKKISFLPGEKDNSSKKPKECKNFCEICKVIYKSKEDKSLGKKFRRQNQWIGCDLGCDYWVHARCVEIKLTGKAEAVEFKCPNH